MKNIQSVIGRFVIYFGTLNQILINICCFEL